MTFSTFSYLDFFPPNSRSLARESLLNLGTKKSPKMELAERKAVSVRGMKKQTKKKDGRL